MGTRYLGVPTLSTRLFLEWTKLSGDAELGDEVASVCSAWSTSCRPGLLSLGPTSLSDCLTPAL